MIEVEKRAVLDVTLYEELGAKLLELGAVDVGENNTSSTFYLDKDWQLKVQRLASKGKAKIAWKSGGIDGAESRREIELSIDSSDIEKANEIISAIVPRAEMYPTEQKRHDYTLGHISIAIKYSNDWGYHVEFDSTVEDSSLVDQALVEINALADDLSIKLLTPEEEKDLISVALKQRNKG